MLSRQNYDVLTHQADLSPTADDLHATAASLLPARVILLLTSRLLYNKEKGLLPQKDKIKACDR